MKRIKNRTIAMNPLANAVGRKITAKEKELTLDTGKLSFAKLRQLAVPTEVKLQLHKIEMPLLPDMKYIGHSGEAEYHALGASLAKHMRYKDEHNSKGKCEKMAAKWLRKKIVTTRVFTFNDNSAWKIFSRDYYPQKITNLYKNINDWFELQFRAKVQDIAETKDKTEKVKKENELKDYVQNSLLKREIEAITTENQDNREEVMKCIESFVLNPQVVLEHQYSYFNTITGQEYTNIATEIKRGIKDNIKHTGRSVCINGTNALSNELNNYDRKIYENALKALPEYSFLQGVNDNIDAAFNYIDSFSSTDVSIGQTRGYTKELGEFNTPNDELYGSGKNSDKWVYFAAAGILLAVVYAKKKKS